MNVRASAVLALLLLTACATTPVDLKPDERVAERRAIQSRGFKVPERLDLLGAGVNALRDLGFTVDEIDAEAGLVSATTERDISEVRNAVLQIGILLLTGATVPMPEREQLSLSLVVLDARVVYVSCERRVWNDDGSPLMSGRVEQPEFYARLFDAMATTLFLEEEL